MKNIQMKDSDEFQEKAAKAHGDKPCNHSRLLKEYMLGTATGDYICEDCGRMGFGSDWPEKERQRRAKG
ncbi:hypothetical protein MKY95_19395 [Paenibacillus sp. FSL P4-0176]|uniref:hypothetical protein n=1 Tax=Paenibacillus sp. FSL P4-0176 TaxID=2921631 RepID=UPI0030D12484